jgi:hypothetical protein
MLLPVRAVRPYREQRSGDTSFSPARKPNALRSMMTKV